MSKLTDERDVRFVLYEMLGVDKLTAYPRYAEHSKEMCDMVLEQALKQAGEQIAPANQPGDREGCSWDKETGHVSVPACYHPAFQAYIENCWLAMTDGEEVGGQGFPVTVGAATTEIFGAANWTLMMYPGLTHGAARLLETFGTDEQKEKYMTKLFSGEWCGTMCLTEPDAGSDVGNLRTKAKKNKDGTYSISGTKSFISGGEHDLTENIVHLVLARIEGAPRGTKGISIFIVPKLIEKKGKAVPNDVVCAGIEHKMGIHGSSTCTLNFGENGKCIGYLIGEENKGMRIMFTMMNEARLWVGLQGLCLGTVAYQAAVEFARERKQFKAPIINFPDVRRMLTHMKAVTEGMRALLYYTAWCQDMVRCSENDEEREKYRGLVDVLIPICKAYSTDMGFRVCETAIQVHGGYGYCSEYPVEQYMRDCKIASIYEGTNGIQALDLIGRKLKIGMGKLFKLLAAEMIRIIQDAKGIYELKDMTETLELCADKLERVTKIIAFKGLGESVDEAALYATPYLELAGDVIVGTLLLWQARIAHERLQEIYRDAGAEDDAERKKVLSENERAAFYAGKMVSAEYFMNSIVTLVPGKVRAITNGKRGALDIPEVAF